jgi:hypothetical protein
MRYGFLPLFLSFFLLALCPDSSPARALEGALAGRLRQVEPRAGAIQGRVTDGAGAPVVAALVELLPGTGGGGAGATRAGAERVLAATTTNANGAYRLAGVAPGSYRVRVQQLGYEPQTVELRLAAGELLRHDVVLVLAPVLIDSLLVESTLHTRRERARFEADAGVTARVVTSAELKIIPGLAEADVMRAVEVLPGVISTSDFSSAFNVRGGSADQNLILLDGFPIFNPFHLGGLFSVFNSDVLSGAELLAGGFGAEHGGRVSSVLNVESRDYTDSEFSGEAGVSLLATRFSVHGSLPAPGSLGGGWFVSARRSYFDKVLPADLGLPYHLTDLQAGLTLGTPGGGQLRVTAYTGDDVLDMSKRERKPRDPDDDGVEFPRLQWRWGNDLLGVRWDQPWGEWVSTARVGVSRYDEGFGLVDLTGPSFASRVRQLFARAELARDLAPGLALRFGGEANQLRAHNSAEGGGTSFWDQLDRGTQGSGFVQLGWRPGEAWLLDSGVRLDTWSAGGATRAFFAPRLALKRFLGSERSAAVKLALGRYTQFLHAIDDESLPFGNHTWVLAGPTLPIVISDQVQLGVEKFWGEEWSASAEPYYRDFRGLAALNTADDLNDPSDDYLTGTGRSYGLDLQLRKGTGRLTGWTTLSLLKAERTFPDLLSGGWEDLPPTMTYAPRFDRRVDLDVVLQLALPGATEFGLRFNFGTGIPYTRPVAQHIWWEYDPVNRVYRISSAGGDDPGSAPLMVVVGPRNGVRYPAYHRADVSLRRTFEKGWGKATPYLQVLNVYNRKNPLFYFFDYSGSPATMSGISMFPVLPTIGVEVSF